MPGYTTDCNHLAQLTKAAAAVMTVTEKYVLPIVDCAKALFQTKFCGRAMISARQECQGHFILGLQQLADQSGVAVVLTKQVASAWMGETTATDGLGQHICPFINSI